MQKEADSRLSEVFARLNLSDFPVLKENARAINRLAASPNSTMQEMVETCQKDYGLTAKLLREANGAYFSHSLPVCSVPAAAGRLGLAAINVHLAGITELENVVTILGDNKIIPLISKSFLSACLARTICLTKKYVFHPDEAFVCSLLHRMGKLAALLFLPDRHRRVVALMEDGASEDEAARHVFYGISYSELGMELGRFWNFSERIISSMQPAPPPPRGVNDPEGILQCLSSLSNALVESVCESGQTNILFDRYGKALLLNKEEALEMLEISLTEAKSSGKTYRQCLLGYMISGKIRRRKDLLMGSIRKKAALGDEGSAGVKEEIGAGDAGQVKKFFDQVNKALKEKVNFTDFAGLILEALCRGIGLDSVLLTSLETKPTEMYLKGRLGAGDIPPDQVQAFRYPLEDAGDIFFNALTLRRDVSIIVDSQASLAPKVKKDFLGHYLSIFILNEEKGPAGLLLLDRKPGRFPISETHLKVASAFRDLLMMGFRKNRNSFGR